ncbi:hypothetical protein J4218_00300 [Candidatus Pacearchaeota archaeon]|nr:hypothetical protein [Candidatus Pacearchaeota archaeon]
MIDISLGMWAGIGLIIVSVILFIVGWFMETIRTILFIVGVVVLILSGALLYFGKIPFF